MSTYNKFSVLSVDNLENLQTTGKKKRSKSKTAASTSKTSNASASQANTPSNNKQQYSEQITNFPIEQTNDPMGSLFGKVKNPSPEQRTNLPLEINTGQMMYHRDGMVYDAAKEETEFYENFVEPHLVDKLPEFEDENYEHPSAATYYEDLSESSAFSPPSIYSNQVAVANLRHNYPVQQQYWQSQPMLPNYVETRIRSRSGGSKNLTPLSPARVSLQSISTAETLIKSLEALTENNNIPLVTLQEWIMLINESDSHIHTNSSNIDSIPKYVDENLHYLSFKEVFLKSRTLEKLVEKLLYTPQQLASYDKELLELFDLCLVGSPQNHQRLLELIKHLQRCGAGKPNTLQRVTSIISVIVTSLKRNDVQKSLQSSLQSTDTAILAKSESLNNWGHMKQSSRIFAEKDALYRELLQLCESKRQTLENYKVKAAVQDDSLIDFRNIANEIETLSHPSKDTPLEKRRQITLEKNKAEQVYTDRINQVNKSRDKIEAQKGELLKEKAELEAKLEKVNNEIQVLDFELQSYMDATVRFEREYRDQLRRLQVNESTFLGILNLQREEKQTFGFLQALINLGKSIIEENKSATLDFVQRQLLLVMRLYVDQTVNHLANQKQLLQSLIKKMGKYCQKIYELKNKLGATTIAEDRSKLENAIKIYYIKYLQKATKAEDILSNAEEINNTAHMIAEVQDAVKESIDPKLQDLSLLENYMLSFNSELIWLQNEAYIQSMDSKEFLDDSSDISSSVSYDHHKIHKSGSANNTMKISKSNNSMNSSQIGSPYSSLNESATPRINNEEIISVEPIDQLPAAAEPISNAKAVLEKSNSTGNMLEMNTKISAAVVDQQSIQQQQPSLNIDLVNPFNESLPLQSTSQKTLQRSNSNSVISSKSEASSGSGSSGNSNRSKKKKHQSRAELPKQQTK